MLEMNSGFDKKERKLRRKKLLRAYREDQQARIWNKVMDEVGFCDLAASEGDSESFEMFDRTTDPELGDAKYDHLSWTKILKDLFECD